MNAELQQARTRLASVRTHAESAPTLRGRALIDRRALLAEVQATQDCLDRLADAPPAALPRADRLAGEAAERILAELEVVLLRVRTALADGDREAARRDAGIGVGGLDRAVDMVTRARERLQGDGSPLAGGDLRGLFETGPVAPGR